MKQSLHEGKFINREAKVMIDGLRNEIVRAGAGAGKTTRLTGKVIEVARSYYKQYGAWPPIVVTTFTRKATQELRERLVLQACEAEDFELLDYVSSKSKLHISTIHGVLSLFLKRYGHLVELDVGFTVISDVEAVNLARKVLRSIILEKFKEAQFLETFDFSRLLKMVLFYSEIKMKEPKASYCTLESFQKILISNVRELADELAQVSSRALEETQEDSWVPYFTQYVALARGMSEAPESYEADHIIQSIKDIGKKPSYREGKTSLSGETHERFKELLARAKKTFSHEAYQRENWKVFVEAFQEFEKLGTVFHQEYFQLKQKLGYFEMGDLELQALDVLRKEPELGRYFSEEWKFWFVDEYQDTSPIQVEILNQLVGESKSFIVGDPQQSIYLFRGARSEVFKTREDEIKKENGILSQLQKNYRSDPELLLFFNDFFQSIHSDFLPMEPKESEGLREKQVVAHFLNVPEEKGEADTNLEYLGLLKHIKKLLDDGVRFDDICVLSLKNKTLDEMAQFLRAKNLPTHVHSSSGFYKRREIQDAISLLKFFLNPHDNLNLMILLRSPWCRVSDDELTKSLSELPRDRSHWSHLNSISGAHGSQLFKDTFFELNLFLEQASKEGVPVAFSSALRKLGMIDFSHYHDATGRRESNLWKLISKVHHCEKQAGNNFLNLMALSSSFWDEEAGNEEGDAVAALEPNCINLMTIHSSKGLQFKHVLLPCAGKRPRLSGQSSRKSPLIWDESYGFWSFGCPIGEDRSISLSLPELEYYKGKDKSELDEFKRVLYVALTRAVESVYISWTGVPEKKSWMDLCGWSLESGIFKKPNEYSYCVEEGGMEPLEELTSPMDLRDGSVRSKYSNAIEAKTEEPRALQKVAVTQLIQKALDSEKSSGSNENVHLNEDVRLKVDPQLKEEALRADAENKSPSFNKGTTLSIVNRLEKLTTGVRIHKLLEILSESEVFDEQEYIGKWFQGQEDDVESALNYLRTLSTPSLWKFLKQGHSEWGFQWLMNERIIEGQVDFWFMDGDSLWIIDYKTGSTKYVEDAFLQLNIYACALEKYISTEIKSTQLCVVYPFEEKTVIRAWKNDALDGGAEILNSEP